MKKQIVVILVLFLSFTSFSQKEVRAFKSGEKLRYKMSYSGFLTAGTAVLELNEVELEGKKVFYSRGSGWTSGIIKWFFKGVVVDIKASKL